MANLTDKEFEAESDLRTLKDAKDIQGDPKRLKAATAMADKQIKALNAVKGSTLLTPNKKKQSLVTK